MNKVNTRVNFNQNGNTDNFLTHHDDDNKSCDLLPITPEFDIRLPSTGTEQDHLDFNYGKNINKNSDTKTSSNIRELSDVVQILKKQNVEKAALFNLMDKERECRVVDEKMKQEIHLRDSRCKDLERQLINMENSKLNKDEEERMKLEHEHKMLKLEMNTLIEEKLKLERDFTELSAKFNSSNMPTKINEENTSIPELSDLRQAVNLMKNALIQKDKEIFELKQKHQLRYYTNQYHGKDVNQHCGGDMEDRGRNTNPLCGRVINQEHRSDIMSESLLREIQNENDHMKNMLHQFTDENGQLTERVHQLERQVKDRNDQIIQLERFVKLNPAVMECSELRDKIRQLESYRSGEIVPLRNSLEFYREDNVKMAANLRDLLQSNAQLQLDLTSLEHQAKDRRNELEACRKYSEKIKMERTSDNDSFQAKLNRLESELKLERDNGKKYKKDFTELKKQCDDLSSKNGSLSRTNLELRGQISELELTVKDGKDRNSSLKSQLDRANQINKKLEENSVKTENLKETIDDLEKSRNTYIKRNDEQASTINSLVDQLNKLKNDVESLTVSSGQYRIQLCEKDENLYRIKADNLELTKKYEEECKRLSVTVTEKQQVENRLEEVCNESLLVSQYLEEAQNWFKSRFVDLHSDLSLSKEKQVELQKENEERRKHFDLMKSQAELLSEKARDAFQASQLFAVQSNIMSKAKVDKLYRQLKVEKDHNRYLELKTARIEESSCRQLERVVTEHSNQQNS